MSKAVLVMDMPKVCVDCELRYYEDHGFWCFGNGEHLSIDDLSKRRPSWCPLRPLPEKQKLTFHEPGQDAITMGWNACIEEIEGNLK